MSLLRTSPVVVQLPLHIDTSLHLSPILNCSAHFSAFSTLYIRSFIMCTTPISHPPSAAACDLRWLKQSAFYNGSPFSLTGIQPPFPCLEHLITLLLPTFILNFFLSHSLPNSLTRRRNFCPTLRHPLQCRVICKQQRVYLKPASIHTLQFQHSPKHPSIHLSHHIIHIYITHPWRHHTTLCQSNFNRKSLTYIHSYPDKLLSHRYHLPIDIHKYLRYAIIWYNFTYSKVYNYYGIFTHTHSI